MGYITFFIVHKNTMPTENMSTEGHLRSYEFFSEANTTSEQLLGSKDNIFDFFPLWAFIKL